MDLTLPLQLLCLWLPMLFLFGWKQQDHTLPSGGKTLHQLVLLRYFPDPSLCIAQDRFLPIGSGYIANRCYHIAWASYRNPT